MMTITHIILLITIILFLLFAIYDEFIIQYRHGKSLLTVKLKNRNRIDGIIFIGLICILFYQYGLYSGDKITGFLLAFLLIISCYIYFIRKPKFILKAQGFFFADFFISYERIKAMNLTQDGVLIIELEVKRILVQVRNLDDLERIYKTLMELNYSQKSEK